MYKYEHTYNYADLLKLQIWHESDDVIYFHYNKNLTELFSLSLSLFLFVLILSKILSFTNKILHRH